MANISPEALENLIEGCLNEFYDRRFEKLNQLKLNTVLRRKNPYLFRAIGTERASEIVESILQAYISSSDETIFGEVYFEKIATSLPGVQVSDAAGVDAIVVDPDTVHAYAIKSGPNPFNSSAKKRQHDEFMSLRNRLYKLQKRFDPVLAYSYGRKTTLGSDNSIYREVSGKSFWKELTDDDSFYLKIITLMKDIPQRKKEEYRRKWDSTINRFEAEFIRDFCFEDGRINWEKLTEFV